jgi:hypothetical protein
MSRRIVGLLLKRKGEKVVGRTLCMEIRLSAGCAHVLQTKLHFDVEVRISVALNLASRK